MVGFGQRFGVRLCMGSHWRCVGVIGCGEGPGFGVEAGIGMGLVGGVKGQVSVGGAG